MPCLSSRRGRSRRRGWRRRRVLDLANSVGVDYRLDERDVDRAAGGEIDELVHVDRLVVDFVDAEVKAFFCVFLDRFKVAGANDVVRHLLQLVARKRTLRIDDDVCTLLRILRLGERRLE